MTGSADAALRRESVSAMIPAMVWSGGDTGCFRMDGILKRFPPLRKELIPILHVFQAEYGYVPRDALARIARFLDISESEIYGVLTFYRAFSLEPRGLFLISVCLGTACHVRGGAVIADELERRLRVRPGGTTPDRRFTLETVNCMGCCAIGPVVSVNGKYHSRMTLKKIESVLAECGFEG
jgi:NADH:ubiquinone oxidoreductase subunit E